MRIWIILFLIFFSNSLRAQESFPELKKILDDKILYSDFKSALELINREIDSYHLSEKTELGVMKMKILTEFGLYDEAIKLSQVLLEDPNLTTEQLIKTRVERALIFEINDELDACKRELDLAEKLLWNNEELMPENYTNFLIRKSSYYRILEDFEQSLELAIQARDYAESVNDVVNLPVVELVLALSYRKLDESQVLEHHLRSLYLYKKLNHKVAVVSTYSNLANYYKKRNNLEMANTFIDSAMENQNDLYLTGYKADIYLEKSEIMEMGKKPDSALYYYKISAELFEKENAEKKDLKVRELAIIYDFEQEKKEKVRIEENFENERKQNNRLILFLALLGCLTTGLALLLWANLKNKRKIETQKQNILASNRALNKNLEEKQFLVQELNHRVKNNLAVILSLIHFQKDQAESFEYKNRFEDLHKRIKTIMIAHELYTYSVNENANSTLEIKTYIERIFEAHKATTNREFDFTISSDDINLHVDKALPFGLMLNEWIVNSLKHADSGKEKLVLHLKINKQNKHIEVEYFDSGKPKLQENSDQNSLGLFIIQGMVKQLGGNYSNENFHYKIQFQNE